MKQIAAEEVKAAISEAFKNITKGDGIGVREARAIDDYADESECQKECEQDVQRWQDIPLEWTRILGEALSFTDDIGFRFLLPAAMMASLENTVDTAGSIFFHLCLMHPEEIKRPHHGYREYIEYLRKISPGAIAKQRNLTAEQAHAIAIYFLWWMQKNEGYLFRDRQREVELMQKMNKQYLEKVSRKNYNLSVEDEIDIFDEECRILKDWLILGGISIDFR